jgi:nicotinate dehydrogenase subunit B
MNQMGMTRRQMLKMGGILMVCSAIPAPLLAAASQENDDAFDKPLDRLSSFIAIAPDGSITAFSGHVDLGTGIRTALAQLVADELAVAFERVTMVLGDTDKTPDQGPTIASATIQVAAIPLRQAAAQLRTLLIRLGAERFGVSVQNMEAKDGRLYPAGKAGESIGYGEIVQGQSLVLPLDSDIPLTRERRYIGQPVPRVDIPAKVSGGTAFVHDIRLPGMLHGRVVRPPYVGADSSAPLGHSLVSVDKDSIAHIKGIVKLVVIGDFIGIVAQREEQAIAAMYALKVEWKPWSGLPDLSRKGLHQTLSDLPKTPRQLRKDEGADDAWNQSPVRLSRDYVWPFHAHASIGPSCAVAHFTDPQRLELWSGSQAPHDLRKELATLMKMDEPQIVIHRHEASGCYGRNCADDVTADAALLARAVGKPVRVQLMREQEMGWEPKGTGQLIRLQGGLTQNHEVNVYRMQTCYPSNGSTTLALLLTGAVANQPVVLQMGDRTAIPQYQYPKMDVVCEDAAPVVRSSWLRGVSALPNVFAHESWIDEVAWMAGVDPIAYRLRYLKDPRAIAMIAALKKRADWQEGAAYRQRPRDQRILKGRGFAYARYFHSKFPGFGAAWASWICDVSVDTQTGQVTVDRVFVAHDCGMMVNPAGVRHQVHGNVIQSTSRALKEFVSFNSGAVTSADWGGYPILRFDELPEVDILLIENPDQPPMGAGESASVPSAAAIANAIFDAAGIRLTEVPFTPKQVLAALRNHREKAQ